MLHVVEAVGAATGGAGQGVGVRKRAEHPGLPALAGAHVHQLQVEVVDEGWGGIGGGFGVGPGQGSFQLVLARRHIERKNLVGSLGGYAGHKPAVAHGGHGAQRIGLAEAAHEIHFGPAEVVGAVQQHGLDERGGWQGAALVAVGLLQQHAQARHQRGGFRGAAFAVGHQLGFHAAVVGRPARAECAYLPAGVGGAHAQRVLRHLELPREVGVTGNALVRTAGAGLRARVARRKNVHDAGKLPAMPVVFLRFHAVVILNGNPVGVILHRHARLGEQLTVVGQQAGKVGRGQAHLAGHAPAQRVGVAGPPDERGHGRGVLGRRPRKGPNCGHAPPKVQVGRVERLFFYRHREALPGQLREADMHGRNGVN